MNQTNHWMTPFYLLLGLLALAAMMVPLILYILTLQKALDRCHPASRTISPPLVWLMLVPLANLVMNFIIVFGMANTLRNEFVRRGLPLPEPEPGKTIGLAMAICISVSFIPILGVFTGLAGFILWILYWVKIAGYSSNLQAALPATAPVQTL